MLGHLCPNPISVITLSKKLQLIESKALAISNFRKISGDFFVRQPISKQLAKDLGGAMHNECVKQCSTIDLRLRGAASVPWSVIAGVVAVRYILLPLLGTVLVKAAVRFGVIQPDPLYQFILLLQYAVPPAMNIGTITQLFGVGESECSVIFVWVYALASVAVTVWSAFFMWTLS
ncbi:hypothetical protein ACQ4PT_061692 [Festuca glaucescens]